jgi:cyclopropane fatty-acyl-phospholipid synthase-like methyltransferase
MSENVNNSDTVVSGRYEFQIEDEKRIILDVINKLDIQPSDHILDIGCGPGTLVLPLSFFAKEVCGIDNSSAIGRINKKSKELDNINTISGNFLDMDFSSSKLYEKIIIYSVIQYLSSEDELLYFLEKAFKLLSPGGRLLIGDIPNIDKKNRYEKSPSGIRECSYWKQKISDISKTSTVNSNNCLDEDLININDACYLNIINFARSKGFESYLLPEPGNLPFGKTRDDILIVSHK